MAALDTQARFAWPSCCGGRGPTKRSRKPRIFCRTVKSESRAARQLRKRLREMGADHGCRMSGRSRNISITARRAKGLPSGPPRLLRPMRAPLGRRVGPPPPGSGLEPSRFTSARGSFRARWALDRTTDRGYRRATPKRRRRAHGSGPRHAGSALSRRARLHSSPTASGGRAFFLFTGVLLDSPWSPHRGGARNRRHRDHDARADAWGRLEPGCGRPIRYEVSEQGGLPQLRPGHRYRAATDRAGTT